MKSIYETFIQIQINDIYDMIKEIIRVQIIKNELKNTKNKEIDEKMLYEILKIKTENELGIFPADRSYFKIIYEKTKSFDPLDLSIELIKESKEFFLTPKPIIEIIKQDLADKKTILITEGEKQLYLLKELKMVKSNKKLTITTENKIFQKLFEIFFSEKENIKIRKESIYEKLKSNEKYDYIFSTPHFGMKIKNNTSSNFSSEGLALDNLKNKISKNGNLYIILPIVINFSNKYKELRKEIEDRFSLKEISVLGNKTFNNITGIKTYLLNISNEKNNDIILNEYQLEEDELKKIKSLKLNNEKFYYFNDWKIEYFLKDETTELKEYNESSLKKEKLDNVAEVFRGKSILKKDIIKGNVHILNIADIENNEIDYSNLNTTDEEERKIKKYELDENDVVVSCRGTTIKTAIFKKQNYPVIASANLIVIRPKKQILGQYLKIFLESPIGKTLIKTFQRGTVLMNINVNDIKELEIPLLSKKEQKEIIDKYIKNKDEYKKIISEAEEKWNKTKKDLYSKFI